MFARTKGANCFFQFPFQLAQILAAGIFQAHAFQILPHALIRIQVRRIRRESLQLNPLICSLRQKGFDILAPVDRGSIPYDQQFAGDMLEQMLKKLHHVRAFEGFLPHLNIEPALFRNTTDDRKMVMAQFMAQNGRFLFGRIGAARERQQVKSGFISKYYCPAFF